MLELEIIFGKKEMPSSLSTHEVLGGLEEGEILMISEYNDGMRRPEQKMSPMGNGTNNSEQFAIIDLVITFCRVKGFWEIKAGMIISVVIFLEKNTPSGDKGSIGGNGELLLGVRIMEDGGSAEGFLDRSESIFLWLWPNERNILFGKVDKGMGEVGEARNELMIEVAEA